MRRFALCLCAILALSISCGGGGGGPPPSTNNPPTAAPPSLEGVSSAFFSSLNDPSTQVAFAGDVAALLLPQDFTYLDSIGNTFLVGTIGAGFFLQADRVPLQLINIWGRLAASPSAGLVFAELSRWAATIPSQFVAPATIRGTAVARSQIFSGSVAPPTPCALAAAQLACSQLISVLGSQSALVGCVGNIACGSVDWTTILSCSGAAVAAACAPGGPLALAACDRIAGVIASVAAGVGLANSLVQIHVECASSASAENVEVHGFTETATCTPVSATCNFGTAATLATATSQLQSALASQPGVTASITGSNLTTVGGQQVHGSVQITVNFAQPIVIPGTQWDAWYGNLVASVQSVVPQLGALPSELSISVCLTVSQQVQACFSVL